MNQSASRSDPLYQSDLSVPKPEESSWRRSHCCCRASPPGDLQTSNDTIRRGLRYSAAAFKASAGLKNPTLRWASMEGADVASENTSYQAHISRTSWVERSLLPSSQRSTLGCVPHLALKYLLDSRLILPALSHCSPTKEEFSNMEGLWNENKKHCNLGRRPADLPSR